MDDLALYPVDLYPYTHHTLATCQILVVIAPNFQLLQGLAGRFIQFVFQDQNLSRGQLHHCIQATD